MLKAIKMQFAAPIRISWMN